MLRSIFEQTLYEMIVVRKNLTNANLSLDEGKIDEERRERGENKVARYLYIKKKKKRMTPSFQSTINRVIV